jgi:hypothetical protein
MELQPDLLLITGDLTSYGTFDVRELAAVKRWLDTLSIDYLCIPGNHDLGANRDRGERYPLFERYEPIPWRETNFGRVFHQSPVVTYDLGQYLLVALAIRDEDPDGSLSRLRSILSGTDRHVIVAGHYPLIKVRDKGILSRFGADGYLDNTAGLLRDILTSDSKVLAYLCGHVHAASVKYVDGRLLQLSAGALGPGPSVGWTVDLYDHGVEWSMSTLFGKLTFWDDSELEGEDPVVYHLGPEAERGGRIDLVNC